MLTDELSKELSPLIHELNQPLSAIIAYSYCCLNLVNDNAQLTELFEALKTQAERAGAIAQNIQSIVQE